MRLDVSQQMKMDQRMVMAPRMIQSMEILQLPILALQERIEQEMLSNPLLEIEEPAVHESGENGERPSRAETEMPDGERTLTIREDASKKEDFERLNNVGDDFDDYMHRTSYQRSQRSGGDPDKKLEAMQNTAAPSKSLEEHLREQWVFVECDPLVHRIGDVIIGFIDDTGYLSMPLDDIAPHVREAVTPAQMESALKLVQTLEPTGVGARDLAECLKIQLENEMKDRSLELEIIEHHLKDIEMNRFPAIAKKTGRTIEDIQRSIKIIGRLDPRPGLQISPQNPQYITPEIIVEYDEPSDSYVASLVDGSIPSLRINTDYSKMLTAGQVGSDAKEFIQNSTRSARWLIESIEQRRHTLMRVVNHVLLNQREFFDNGPLYLKPLPMVEVAESLGIHVGTVSRAVSGKYMQTPTGIYPLRYFFSGGTETANGESVSWDAVKAKLQEIIDKEDKSHPLSDDALVDELTKHGITLARRTVAKYRSLMNIPPARRRKQY